MRFTTIHFGLGLEITGPEPECSFVIRLGNTGPDALFNLGTDSIVENDYVFMHDQEPVHLDTFEPLFKEVLNRNTDLWRIQPGVPLGVNIASQHHIGHVIV
jgi:hypothetical protein